MTHIVRIANKNITPKTLKLRLNNNLHHNIAVSILHVLELVKESLDNKYTII